MNRQKFSPTNRFPFLRHARGVCLCAALALLPAFGQAAEELVEAATSEWRGDFEDMLKRRQIRALVVYNPILYFLDGPTQRGTTYDALEEFRTFIDEKYNLKSRKFHVIYIPVRRDRLLDALREGRGDVAVANLTITPERSEIVDFTDPVLTGVTEILVTGPSAPEINTLIDLAGKEIFVRESSSYFTSLVKLNREFEEAELDPVRIVPVDEYLEDADLIEMVSAGLLPMVIVDSHKAEFWADIFENITARTDIAINREGDIGWAIRKNSPTLAAVLNEFIRTHRKGTMFGNIILKRYLKENEWVRNALVDEEVSKYREAAQFFQKYGEDYGFDWLMLAALGYQESRLDQSTRSPAGAIGVMQLLPSTASDDNVGIPDIEVLENNIHAGTKYLGFLRDRYFSDAEIDDVNQTLFTFAAYNAGPAKVARIRKTTRESGLDHNVWFGNVEHIAAKQIGRETVQYVSNIYKYYVAYKIVSLKNVERKAAKAELKEQID